MMPGSNRKKRKRKGKARVEEMSREGDLDLDPQTWSLRPTASSVAGNDAVAHAAAKEETTTKSLAEGKVPMDFMTNNEHRERIIETLKTEYSKCQKEDFFQHFSLSRKAWHLMYDLKKSLPDIPDANLPTEADVSTILDALASATSGENNLDAKKNQSKDLEKNWLEFNTALIKNGIDNHNDPNDVLGKFSNHLDQCSRLILESSHQYYAAYTVLFQSSGMGKTHLLLKTLEHRYGLYLCFRSTADSLNYPPRSPIADWVVGNTDHWHVHGRSIYGFPMLRFASIIVASQKLFEKWYNEPNKKESTPKAWLDHMEGNDGFQAFGEELLELAQSEVQEIIKKDDSKRLNADYVFDSIEEFREPPFLFCIDEGRELLPNNAFQDVSRCFKTSYAQSKHYFGIFTDTLSTLINFAPHRSAETATSARGAPSSSGDHLLPPFCDVLNIDTNVKGDGSQALETYGRPLWKRYAEELGKVEPLTDKVYTGLRDFARLKLLKTKRQNAQLHTLSVNQKRVASLACLACRASIFVSPGRRLAGELVGGHMAVCCHVYEEREAMIIGYPSEPILADASAAVLKTNSLTGWKTALPELQRAIETAEVDTGKVGEVVQRIIFLLAIDLANRTKDGKVTALTFLETLVGKGRLPNKLYNILQEIFVDFNHFVQLSMVADKSKCVECIQRKAAVACKAGQKGIDQEIYFVDNDGKHAGTLVSQTKNCSTKYDTEYPSSAGWKMSSRFALDGTDRCNEQENAKKESTKKTYLALYHNVGYPGQDKEVVVFKEEEQEGHSWTTFACCPPARFELMGLDIPLFDTKDSDPELQQNLLDIKTTLKAIVNLGRNPIDRLPEQHRTTARKFFPVAYNNNKK
jgi:hypothetical protein